MKNRIHIRCPVCGGRLFDVTSEDMHNKSSPTLLDVELRIKCWKCHNTISIKNMNMYNYLVQASHAYDKIGKKGVEA